VVVQDAIDHWGKHGEGGELLGKDDAGAIVAVRVLTTSLEQDVPLMSTVAGQFRGCA
jgi:hypothetical protein